MSSLHKVVIALGSNLGDRSHSIEFAVQLLEHPMKLNDDGALPAESSTILQNASLKIVDASFMYETAPMYVTDQPVFLNCACIVETNLEPLPMLKLVKLIEDRVGRVPSIRYGPRAVDLDIIFFDNAIIDTRSIEKKQADPGDVIGELVIPHPKMAEREFVLKPITDMIPEYEHPVLHKTMKTLLSELKITNSAVQLGRMQYGN